MVITPEQMKELIDRRPYQTVRLHLDDGSTVDVLFPELTLVTRLDMFIGYKDPKSLRRIARDGVFIGWSVIKNVEILSEAAVGEERK